MYICNAIGGLAHLARARHWQCRGDRFESGNLHKKAPSNARCYFFVEITIRLFIRYFVAAPRRVLVAFGNRKAKKIIFFKTKKTLRCLSVFFILNFYYHYCMPIRQGFLFSSGKVFHTVIYAHYFAKNKIKQTRG